MVFLKLFHETDKGFDAFVRHGIIEACPHAADTAVAFEIDQAFLFGFPDKYRIEIGVTGHEGDIHQRTVLHVSGRPKEDGLIQIIVKKLRLGFVDSLHFRQTAEMLQPFEDFAADIDTVAVRSIIKRTGIILCLKLHHRRCSFQNIVRDQILPDNGNDQTGRANIFLYSAVHDSVFCYIYRLRKETG